MGYYPYVLYFAICVFTPLNHSPNADQCIMAAPPTEHATLEQCKFEIGQARLRFSKKEQQTLLYQTTPLPKMVDGNLYFMAECRVKVDEGFLQCVDCEL